MSKFPVVTYCPIGDTSAQITSRFHGPTNEFHFVLHTGRKSIAWAEITDELQEMIIKFVTQDPPLKISLPREKGEGINHAFQMKVGIYLLFKSPAVPIHKKLCEEVVQQNATKRFYVESQDFMDSSWALRNVRNITQELIKGLRLSVISDPRSPEGEWNCYVAATITGLSNSVVTNKVHCVPKHALPIYRN